MRQGVQTALEMFPSKISFFLWTLPHSRLPRALSWGVQVWATSWSHPETSPTLALGWWETPQQNNTSEASTAPTQHQQFLKQRPTFRVGSLQSRICTSLCTAEAPSPASSNPSCPLLSPQAILLSAREDMTARTSLCLPCSGRRAGTGTSADCWRRVFHSLLGCACPSQHF